MVDRDTLISKIVNNKTIVRFQKISLAKSLLSEKDMELFMLILDESDSLADFYSGKVDKTFNGRKVSDITKEEWDNVGRPVWWNKDC